MFAVQGQDPRGFRLAVRARTSGTTAADVDRALTEDRSLVVTWVNRGTLHLVRSEDYPLIQAVTTPPLGTGSLRRLEQEGVPARHVERGIAAIERALADEGPLTGRVLRERIAAAGVRSQGQALYHLLFQASLRGLVVRGPMAGKQHAYVLVRDWLDDPEPVDRDAALGEFARRYLAGHGPASDRDLARWAGVPLRDARAGLGAIARDLEEIGEGLVDLRVSVRRRRRNPPELPPPKLLGSFEPSLLGWTSRDDIVGKDNQLVTAGGMFYPFVLVGGRAAGRWSIVDGEVGIDPFGRLGASDRKALDAEAQDVVRFLAIG